MITILKLLKKLQFEQYRTYTDKDVQKCKAER